MESNTPEQPDNKATAHALANSNAFTDPKLQLDPDRPHLIRTKATNAERDGEQYVVAPIPVRELQKARRGTSAQRRGIGFALEVEFELPNQDGTYVLTSSWVTINVR